MRAAIEHRKISPDQYIGQQHRTVTHGINRRLVLYYLQYLQQPLSIACSDLKICYEIIFHLGVRLELQQLGIPIQSILSMLDTIHHM